MNQIASDEIVNLGSGRAGPRRLHHLPCGSYRAPRQWEEQTYKKRRSEFASPARADQGADDDLEPE